MKVVLLFFVVSVVLYQTAGTVKLVDNKNTQNEEDVKKVNKNSDIEKATIFDEEDQVQEKSVESQEYKLRSLQKRRPKRNREYRHRHPEGRSRDGRAHGDWHLEGRASRGRHIIQKDGRSRAHRSGEYHRDHDRHGSGIYTNGGYPNSGETIAEIDYSNGNSRPSFAGCHCPFSPHNEPNANHQHNSDDSDSSDSDSSDSDSSDSDSSDSDSSDESHNNNNNNGYLRQWQRAFAAHPCCRDRWAGYLETQHRK